MPSPPGLKKALNFAKFHARGGRGLQQGHPRIGAPLPGHSPRRARRGGTPGGTPRRLPPAAGYPGTPGRRAATLGGAARTRRATLGAAATSGATLGARARRLPGAGGSPEGGLPGETGRFLRRTAGLSGRGATGRVTPGGGGLAVPGRLPGGVYRGAATRRRAARRHSPRSGRLPRRLPGGAKSMIRGRPVTGIRRTGCWAGYRNRGAAGVYRVAGAEIFCGGGGYRGKTPATALSRAYIEALLQTARRGYFLDKTPEK